MTIMAGISKRIRFLLVFSVFFLTIGIVQASTYYVSPLGSDLNNGLSLSTPWNSLSKSTSKLVAGDTLYLMNGTWKSESLVFAVSGTQSNPITLTSYGGKAVLDGVNRTAGKTAISIYDSSKTLSYININNIVIHDYTRGIFIRNVNNIKIDSVEVYNTHSIGVDMSDCTKSSLTNSNIHDTGWNSVSVTANSINPTDISIVNNQIHDNPGTSGHSTGHNLIDLFNYGKTVSLKNIRIEGNKLYNGGLGNSAIFEHGYNSMYNMRIINNTIYNTRQVEIDRFVDSIVSGNTIYNQPGYGITALATSLNNVTLSNNTIHNTTWKAFRVMGSSNSAKPLVIKNNDIAYYRVDNKYGIIENPKTKIFSICSASGASISLQYTDNKVFKENGAGKITYLPDKSIYKTVGDETVSIQSYSLYVTPSSGQMGVKVNKFDTSLSKGSLIVDFQVTGTSVNSVNYVVGDLIKGAGYLIKKDGSDYRSVVADYNGHIQFTTPGFSSARFTLVQTSASQNLPPTASISANITDKVGEAITFDGSSSTDDRQIVSYSWDFNSSDGIQSDAIGSIVTHTYNKAGTYTVTLTVTDEYNLSSATTKTVTVVTTSITNTFNNTILSIVPSSIEVTPGQAFSIDINIDPAMPI